MRIRKSGRTPMDLRLALIGREARLSGAPLSASLRFAPRRR
jgi:hypothetical protein